MGGGYIEENGPFVYQPNPAGPTGLMFESINATANPYTWAATANMVRKPSLNGSG